MKTICTFFILSFSVIAFSQDLRIAAAADLRYTMDELVALYKKSNPQAQIEVIYGSSGNAYTQIFNGAPYDMYFSADILYPQKLYEAGVTAGPPTLYAVGRIVLWSSTIDVSNGFSVLQDYPNIRLAIANPAHAPYGKRAVEALQYYKQYDAVKPRLIYGENISQAAQFCITGNARIGILALSLALSPVMEKQGNYYVIDAASHKPLRQGFVITKRASNNAVAHSFAQFIETPEARAIFEKYGFTKN